MKLGLRGKAAVVSGSTAGIGLAIATALAAEGAKVVVNGRTEARVPRRWIKSASTLRTPNCAASPWIWVRRTESMHF